MIIMSIFPYMLGIAFLLLFKGIVGQDCITQQFSNQNSVVNLNCSISPFSGTGSWTVDGVGPKTNCAANSFCTTTVDGNYTFTSDSYGIYVKIDPFLTDEIGKIWKCEHAPSINCNIALSGPTTSGVTTEGSTEGLKSATPSSETTSEMDSTFLKVTGTVDLSNVLPSFESTDFTFKPGTSLNANTLSYENSLSQISPFSPNGSLEPTEMQNNEYKTSGIEVDSMLFSLKTLNFTDETVTTRLYNSAISTSMVTSSRNNLQLSSVSVLFITTGISLQVDLPHSRDLQVLTTDIIQNIQTQYTSLFSFVLLHTETSVDSFPSSTITARFDTKFIDTLSSQSSFNSSFISLVAKENSDIFSLSISPQGPGVPVATSSNNQIYTSGDPWSVRQTEFVLVNTSTVDSVTSNDNAGSVSQIETRTEGTTVGQNYPLDNSFSPVDGFSISIFPYSSSLRQGQLVYTSLSQTLSFFDLSSVLQTVQSTDLSVNKIVSSSKSYSTKSFLSFGDTLTLPYTELSANESISSLVDTSLHLSFLDNLGSLSSETFNGNSQFYQLSDMSSTPLVKTSTFFELTTTSSAKYLTLTEGKTTPSINHFSQSDLLSETSTQVTISIPQSSHISDDPSADIYAKSSNVLSLDIFTLRQTSQTLPLSTYSSFRYEISSTIGQQFNTSFISTVIQINSTPLVASVQMIIDTFSLSQFPEGTNVPFGTSSMSITLSTVMRSASFHDVSLLSPSSSLNFASFTQLFSFSKIMSTNINTVVTSNFNAIQSSDTIYVSSSQPASRPIHTPELSFREAQIIIISCSIAAVILVIFVPFTVMYCLGKLPRGNIQNEKYANSEIDGFNSFNYPYMGQNITLRYHSRSLSDSLYTGDFEKNWNSLTC